jgi:adenine-specific DNA-methyltransferase
MAQNVEDGGNRRYILVQLPEPLDPENKDQKVAAEFCDSIGKPRNIAELTKERLRRAADRIREEHPDYEGDLGFRVFKLDSSNIRAWDPQPEDLEDKLLEHVDHLKEDRSEEDVLYELLLKLGLDLCVPIETNTIADKIVHSIGAGTLFACLDESLEPDSAEDLALGIVEWRDKLDPAGDTTVVFRDSAFPDDVTKTNLDAILKQHNITTVRSI